MMKRLAFLFIALALLTTQSFAASQTGLKAAFDDFNYAMVVEGAALDSSARQVAVDGLVASIQDLQDQGMSRDQIIAFAQSEIKDKSLAADLTKLYAQMKTQTLTQSEIHDLVEGLSSHMYSRGASWEGDVQLIGMVGGVLLVMVLLAVLIKPGPCANEAYARGNVAECRNSSYNGAYYNI